MSKLLTRNMFYVAGVVHRVVRHYGKRKRNRKKNTEFLPRAHTVAIQAATYRTVEKKDRVNKEGAHLIMGCQEEGDCVASAVYERGNKQGQTGKRKLGRKKAAKLPSTQEQEVREWWWWWELRERISLMQICDSRTTNVKHPRIIRRRQVQVVNLNAVPPILGSDASQNLEGAKTSRTSAKRRRYMILNLEPLGRCSDGSLYESFVALNSIVSPPVTLTMAQ